MQVIIDSGSTKADWIFIDRGREVFRGKTAGLNPHFIGQNDVEEAYRTLRFEMPVSRLWFYGAGCGSERGKQIIRSAFQQIFPGAGIHVETDLLGAARALLKAEAGLIAVLGTGSNSAWYNGREILKSPPSLGYILGDEGSGNALGKRLLKDYLSGRMPDEIRQHRVFSDLDYETAMELIYRKPFPNRYFASLAHAAFDFKQTKYIGEILHQEFRLFFDGIKQFYGEDSRRVALCGSVAWYFIDELNQAAKSLGIEITGVEQSPMKGLVDYHSGNYSSRS